MCNAGKGSFALLQAPGGGLLQPASSGRHPLPPHRPPVLVGVPQNFSPLFPSWGFVPQVQYPLQPYQNGL